MELRRECACLLVVYMYMRSEALALKLTYDSTTHKTLPPFSPSPLTHPPTPIHSPYPPAPPCHLEHVGAEPGQDGAVCR